MKELGRPEASESLEGTEDRVSESSLEELMGREDSPSTMRCWQGEVEVEDRWGIGSPTSRSEGCAPSDRPFGILEKSKSRQRGSSRRLHRVGRRVFSCFRRSTINLTVPDLEPSTPPKSGPLIAPRTSVGGANGVTFMHEALGQHHHVDDDDDLDSDEPTSPVVNCMGQVRPKKSQKHPKKIEPAPRERLDDKEKFRRTKSQAPPRSPPMVSKSKSCKWKQLLRSNSSSISPSNHPCGSAREPEIDLGRFSSASGSSDPFYHQAAGASHADKLPDKTCLLMRRNSTGRSNSIQESHDSSDNTLKLLQEQLDARNSGYVEGEHRKTAAESEPVFRNLPSLKTTRIESPKWIADEPLVNRRQGLLFKPSRMDLQTIKSSSTASSHI